MARWANSGVRIVRIPSTPFAVVTVAGTVVRAPDARRAAHIPAGGRLRSRLDWRMLIDSSSGGVLHSTASFYEPAGANALALVRIPMSAGRLGLPSLVTRPQPIRMTSRIGEDGAELPTVQAEQIAEHAYMKQLLEIGALFESDPESGAGTRRTHYADGAGDIALTLDAVRSSHTLRDTVISGRRVHIVRDSTSITIDHATLQPSRFNKRVGRTRERARGTLVGIRLVDAETHRAFHMRDTLTMRGALESDDGSGDAFTSPLYITSVRVSTLYDAFWQAAKHREPFDMVRYDATRPNALTPTSRDSLFALLVRARALATRDSLRAQLLPTSSQREGDPSIWPRIREHALAIGDTASIVARLMDVVRSTGAPLSADDFRVLRPALASARTAFRIGVDGEILTLDLIDMLLRRPPVTSVPPEHEVCSPAACAAMRADAGSDRSMLAAVGLVAGMVSSPRVWTDSVLHHSATNPFLVPRARWFAQGVASSAGASAKAPIPPPDAPYDAWRHWLTGRDSSYEQSVSADPARQLAAQQLAAQANRRPRSLRASPEAANAVRFAEARTGLAYITAFRRHRDTTSSDSVRVLFNSLLLALGDGTHSDAELVRILLQGSGPALADAKVQLGDVRSRGAAMAPAGDSTARVIGRHVVNLIFGDSALARTDSSIRWDSWYRVQKAADSLPRYVMMHSLPDEVRARAAELGFAPTERGWQLRPGDPAYLIEVGPVRQRGPFVQVSVTHSTLHSRSATRSGGYAGGFTLTLVEGPQGWVVVDATGWVT